MGNSCDCCSKRDTITKDGILINGQTGVSNARILSMKTQPKITKYDKFEMHILELWQNDKKPLPPEEVLGIIESMLNVVRKNNSKRVMHHLNFTQFVKYFKDIKGWSSLQD